jgi:hypothetical protein
MYEVMTTFFLQQTYFVLRKIFIASPNALLFRALQNILLQCTITPRGLTKGAPMSEVWKTKHGLRRVRYDPPTLKEAIVAAQGLTAELQQQAEIAAALMEVPVEEVRAELLKMAPVKNSTQIVASSGREGGARTVTVERRPSRRRLAGAAQPARR